MTAPSTGKQTKTNAAWHQTHRMPAKATLDQRVKWHAAHAKACGCRVMPASIATEIGKRAGKKRSARKS
jgi:hypothetical protein